MSIGGNGGLSAAQIERLAFLAEECGEVTKPAARVRTRRRALTCAVGGSAVCVKQMEEAGMAEQRVLEGVALEQALKDDAKDREMLWGDPKAHPPVQQPSREQMEEAPGPYPATVRSDAKPAGSFPTWQAHHHRLEIAAQILATKAWPDHWTLVATDPKLHTDPLLVKRALYLADLLLAEVQKG